MPYCVEFVLHVLIILLWNCHITKTWLLYITVWSCTARTFALLRNVYVINRVARLYNDEAENSLFFLAHFWNWFWAPYIRITRHKFSLQNVTTIHKVNEPYMYIRMVCFIWHKLLHDSMQNKWMHHLMNLRKPVRIFNVRNGKSQKSQRNTRAPNSYSAL